MPNLVNRLPLPPPLPPRPPVLPPHRLPVPQKKPSRVPAPLARSTQPVTPSPKRRREGNERRGSAEAYGVAQLGHASAFMGPPIGACPGQWIFSQRGGGFGAKGHSRGRWADPRLRAGRWEVPIEGRLIHGHGLATPHVPPAHIVRTFSQYTNPLARSYNRPSNSTIHLPGPFVDTRGDVSLKGWLVGSHGTGQGLASPWCNKHVSDVEPRIYDSTSGRICALAICKRLFGFPFTDNNNFTTSRVVWGRWLGVNSRRS